MNPVVLLTACVNPKGMQQTALQDIDIRKNQYIDAIKFYIDHLNLKIVIVENTLTDLSVNFKNEIKHNKVEFLMFDGNNYDRALGKGYGELLIIKYALLHSKFIEESDYILKITGRNIVRNINRITKSTEFILNKPKSYVASDISIGYTFAPSKVFLASKRFLKDYFIPNINKLNDSNGIYFEHLLAKMIIQWKKDGNKHYIFSFPFIVEGLSGTTAAPIRKPRKIQTLSKLLLAIWYNYINS